MALDLASKVTTFYKADVSDHVRELGKLKGAEKERAQVTIAAHKDLESSLSSQIKTLGKVGLAVGAVVGTVKVMQSAFKEYAEHEKLSTAAVGVDLERLRKASAGLKTETELLADAARLKSGAFKMSAAEMETAERAMLAFTRRGHDATKVNQAVLQAVTALKTEGLQDLGIFVDKAGLSMEKASDRAEIYTRLMAKLKAETVGVGEEHANSSERMKAAGVEWENALHKLQIQLGKIAAALAPIVSALAKISEYTIGVVEEEARSKAEAAMAVLDFIDGGNRRANAQHTGDLSMTEDIVARSKRQARVNQLLKEGNRAGAANLSWGYAEDGSDVGTRTGTTNMFPGIGLDDPLIAERDRQAHNARVLERAMKEAEDYEKNFKKAKRKSGPYQGSAAEGLRILRGGIGGGGNVANGELTGSGLGASADMTDLTSSLSLNGGFDLQQMGADQEAAIAAQRGSKLESMFGPLTDFDAYKTAFDTLSGAVGSALGAWIDGSMSASKAFKMFIAEAVKGIAIQMAMEALKHGAYALGSLAFGDMPGAAKHGKAAAAFAAGAVVASGAAKALHGSSGGAGAAAPVGGAGGGGGGGGGYQGEKVVYVIGDSFGDTTPRERARTFRRRSEEAIGSSGVLHE